VCKNLHMPDVMDFARALYIGAGWRASKKTERNSTMWMIAERRVKNLIKLYMLADKGNLRAHILSNRKGYLQISE
jgi:hypothetical protein